MVLKGLIVVLFLLPVMASAQVLDEEAWLEEYGDEAAAGAMSDYYMQLAVEPVNINDTQSVAALPFISPFQLASLRNYIALYGQLLTLDELRYVPGFDSITLGNVRPFLKAEPFVSGAWNRWWDGRHSLVMGVGSMVEQAVGYRNGRYNGDALHANFCYNYKYADHLSLRMVADKDPTEPWGNNNYFGYHLMVSHVGRLERLILGRYNLQFGQGLAVWTGLQPFSITGGSTARYGVGVREVSTFYEEGYQQGVAATVDVGRGVYLTSFASRDSNETLVGGHLDYKLRNLQVGVTASYMHLDDSMQIRDYAYNYNRFRGTELLNVGIDGLWQWNRLTAYGEVAADWEGAVASIVGLDIAAGNGDRFGVSWRYYDPRYQNLHAAGFGIGSTQGESGFSLNARSHLPLGVVALVSLDIHRFPGLRYGSYSPSGGVWLRAQLERDFGRNMRVKLRYSYRNKERNVPNVDSTLYVGENTLRQQLQAQLQANAGKWRFDTKAAGVLFDCENGTPQHGLMFAQDVHYNIPVLEGVAGMAWFDVSNYYARVYLSESHLQYAWSMPSLNGNGLRGYLLVRFRLNKSIALAAKYSITYYHGQESVGTGDAMTEGPVRQAVFVQLRWRN